MTATEPDGRDAWYAWLLETRHGGDAAYARAQASRLDEIFARTLDLAELEDGQRVADLGCGTGEAGMRVLGRYPASVVAFGDVSPRLIEHVRARLRREGLEGRAVCRVQSAEALEGIADGAFDRVVMRAVLAYVEDKAAAVAEALRVLRPGGRLVLTDPIFQDEAFVAVGLRQAARNSPDDALLRALSAVKSAYYPDTPEGVRADALTSHGERALVDLLATAGFERVGAQLHLSIAPMAAMPWAAHLASAPRAGVPTIGEVLRARCGPEERDAYERALRADVEAGRRLERRTDAYVYGGKPA